MVDAKIPLEDIATRGITLSWAPLKGDPIGPDGTPYAQGQNLRDVTLTITLRRPPQFFVPLVDLHGKASYKMLAIRDELDLLKLQGPQGYMTYVGTTDKQNISYAVGHAASPRKRPNNGKQILNFVENHPSQLKPSDRPTIHANGRVRTLSGQVMLGTADQVMARKVARNGQLKNPNESPLGGQNGKSKWANLKAQKVMPLFQSKEGLGYGGIQPDGIVGTERRKPRETGVLRWRRATEFDFSLSRSGFEYDAGVMKVDGDSHFKVR